MHNFLVRFFIGFAVGTITVGLIAVILILALA